jgi:hypothetical protein
MMSHSSPLFFIATVLNLASLPWSIPIYDSYFVYPSSLVFIYILFLTCANKRYPRKWASLFKFSCDEVQFQNTSVKCTNNEVIFCPFRFCVYFHWLIFSALLPYETFSAHYKLSFTTDAPLTTYKCIVLIHRGWTIRVSNPFKRYQGFPFSKTPRPALEPTKPRIQWVPWFLSEGKATRAWIWPLTSTKRRGQERVELYFYFPCTPSLCGDGTLPCTNISLNKTKAIINTPLTTYCRHLNSTAA